MDNTKGIFGMDFESKRKFLASKNEEARLATGFDKALVGYREQQGLPIVGVYSIDKCIEVLINDEGMGEEEALEHMDYNVTGSYMGENTPVFVTDFEEEL